MTFIALMQKGEPMNDLIDRQAAIDAIEHHKIAVLGDRDYDEGIACGYATAHRHLANVIRKLPSVQPNLQPTCNQLATDCISRKWLMECVEEGWIKFDTEKDENRFIHLVRDIAPSLQPERERTMEEFMFGQDMGNPEDGSL